MVDQPCPAGAIPVAPGTSVQAAVDRASSGATFCLKNGIYREQTIRPKFAQAFYGEGRTVLNGSRLLTGFYREAPYWVAQWPGPFGQRHGECTRETPACGLPEALFLDEMPLERVLSKDLVQAGRFYLDRTERRVFLGTDPAGHRLEATANAAAFDGTASSVVIRNVTIEKYASSAERGAI